MPVMRNINLYIALILKDLLNIHFWNVYTFENAPSQHRHVIVDLRIDGACAFSLLKKKMGVQGKNPLHNMRSECSKINNNDSDSSKFLWIGKRTKEYVNKTTKIA
jgi:hypothetical protein